MTLDKSKFAHIIALFSLIGISFSAPLGRLALTSGAAPIAVGVWRMAFSVPVMAIIWSISLYRNKNIKKPKVELKLKLISILSGIFLGFHFVCWYLALNNTSVFNAAVLVCLQPIYAMIGTYLVYKQKPARSVILPLTVALIGSAVLILPSSGAVGDRSLFGNIMASLSGIFMAAYLMCGRVALQKISLGGYTTVAYSVCLIMMLIIALIFHVPILLDIHIIGICLLLAIAATLFGHSLLNWSLPHVGAFFATVVLLGEPVGASIVAFIMFKTIPSIIEMLGGVMILIGIMLLVLRANRQKV